MLACSSFGDDEQASTRNRQSAADFEFNSTMDSCVLLYTYSYTCACTHRGSDLGRDADDDEGSSDKDDSDASDGDDEQARREIH